MPRSKPTWKGKNTCTLKIIRHWWKKSKTTQIDGKIYHVLGLQASILLKETTLIKAIYRFNAIPIKLSMVFFHRTRTNFFFLICMETHKTLNSQNSLEKNRAGGITLPEFRLYYKVTIIKTAWHCHKIRHYARIRIQENFAATHVKDSSAYIFI